MNFSQHQLFNAILKNSQEGILICDADKVILEANSKAKEWLSIDEKSKPKLQDVVNREDAKDFCQKIDKLIALNQQSKSENESEALLRNFKNEFLHFRVATVEFETKVYSLIFVNQNQSILLEESFFNKLAVPSLLKDAKDCQILKSNEHFQSLLGYSSEELLKITSDKITYPADIEPCIKIHNSLVEGKLKFANYEKRYISKSGKIIWVKINLSPIKDETGTVVKFISLLQDITASKETLISLEESEKQFRAFFEKNPFPVTIRELKSSKFIQVNQEFTKLLGYNSEEATEQINRDLISYWEDNEKRKRLTKELIDGKIHSFTTEKAYKAKDGSIVWCEVTRTVFPINNEDFLLKIIKDITKEKQIRDEQLAKNQLINNLVSFLPIMYYRIDQYGNFTEIRGSAVKSFGFTEEEVLNTNIFDLFKDFPAIINANKRALKGGFVSFEAEVSMRGKSATFDTKVFFDEIHMNGAVGLAFDISESKKILNSMKESELRHKIVFDSSNEGMILSDAKSRSILECNKAMLDILEASKKDMISANPLDFCPQIQPDGTSSKILYLGVMKRAAKEMKPLTFEWFQTTKTGRQFEAEVTICPIVKDGRLLWLNITRDITAKKQVDRENAKIYKEQQLIFDAMPLYFYHKDDKNNILRCNKAGAALMGLSVSELEGKNTSDYFGKDFSEAYLKDDLEVIKSKKPRFNILEQIDSNNGKIWVSTDKVPYVNDDGTVGVLVFAKDVTEVMKTQEDLRISEEKYKDIFENVDDAIVTIDAYGEIKDGNKAFKKIVELNAWQSINIRDLIYPEDTDSAAEHYKHLRETGTFSNYRTRLMNRKGRIVNVEISATAILGKDGGFIGSREIIRDVSEQAEYQLELEENNARLSKINMELDHFVYRASHDMRAPLSSILGLIAVVQMQEPSEENVFLLEKMTGQINKLESFIREIIDYSRISRVEAKPEEVDVKEMVDEIFENMEFMENATKIRKNIDVFQSANFYTDKKSLDVVLSNLISNAIKYADIRKEKPKIDVKIKINEDGASISISDNGIGIMEEYQPKVFDMFVRATDTNSGSGLGLYIVKEVINKIHGTIQLESTSRVGSTFTIRVPNIVFQLNN
jgi:PAS domain S-box-containing protein